MDATSFMCKYTCIHTYIHTYIHTLHTRARLSFHTILHMINSGLVAQWITRLPTEQKIPGSSPGKVDSILFFFTHHVHFIKQ